MNDTTTMHIDSPARPGVALAALNCPPHTPEQTKESLNELTALAETLGFTVVDTFMQSRSAPDPRTFIGRGKLEQMGFALAEKQLELVLFDHDLSPKQSQLIESTLDCMVWDRTQVILEIFARHARTSEA
ncbi:MAG: GTPase HflX, partial [Deltaproteobacteria bacterium]|nr:GTPase HflX [Deltaproteobacteria bacterium]